MQISEFDFSITDIELEGQQVEKSNIGCFISIDNQDID